MKLNLKKSFSQLSIQDYGNLLFLTGIFFLPSSVFIGILFLFPASLVGCYLQKKPYLKDPWNYPFLVFGVLILLSSFFQNYILINEYEEVWDPISSFIGMGNWLPFIWFFWAFQPYLNSLSKRKRFALILVASTFPILATGFGQYYLNWTGPFKTLNGLITWYQRPIENPGGLSGLFNHQNYAGSWLNFVWPFCIALFLDKSKDIFRRIIAFNFLLAIGFAAFLTYSRNAWIGLITSLPIIMKKKGITIFLPLLTITLFLIFFTISPIFDGALQSNIRSFLPERILLEFSQDGYIGLDTTRTKIFLSAIKLIKFSPIFGIGASAFTPIFLLETNFWKGHSHNLLLELSVSYGLPSAIILFITIFIILFLSANKIFFNKSENDISLFDKAFWASLFFFLISQLVDIQYFDGRISIVSWILLAGLKNICDESNKGNLVQY